MKNLKNISKLIKNSILPSKSTASHSMFCVNYSCHFWFDILNNVWLPSFRYSYNVKDDIRVGYLYWNKCFRVLLCFVDNLLACFICFMACLNSCIYSLLLKIKQELCKTYCICPCITCISCVSKMCCVVAVSINKIKPSTINFNKYYGSDLIILYLFIIW